jgi:hypothetical protein
VAGRVGRGEALPELDVGGGSGESSAAGGGAEDGFLVRAAAVGYVVQGMNGQLFTELEGVGRGLDVM